MRTYDVNLLGYRFDTSEEAIKHLEEMSDNRVDEMAGEHYWAVDANDLPEGYKFLVYYVDEINDFDLDRYAI